MADLLESTVVVLTGADVRHGAPTPTWSTPKSWRASAMSGIRELAAALPDARPVHLGLPVPTRGRRVAHRRPAPALGAHRQRRRRPAAVPRAGRRATSWSPTPGACSTSRSPSTCCGWCLLRQGPAHDAAQPGAAALAAPGDRAAWPVPALWSSAPARSGAPSAGGWPRRADVTGVGRPGGRCRPGPGRRSRAVAELPAALAEADYVVLAAPLTDATRDMIDAAALRADAADGAADQRRAAAQLRRRARPGRRAARRRGSRARRWTSSRPSRWRRPHRCGSCPT